MSFETLRSPLRFLESTLSDGRLPDWLQQYQCWWENEGQDISDSIDRIGTPWLRMFALSGTRVDEILYPPEYWRMLRHGYQAGIGQSCVNLSFSDQDISHFAHSTQTHSLL